MPISITIDPISVTLESGQGVLFSAKIEAINFALTGGAIFSCDGGTITEHGEFTAPDGPATVFVTATAVDNATVKAIATVTVNAKKPKDETPPIVIAASVAEDGKSVTLTLSEPVTGSDGFALRNIAIKSMTITGASITLETDVIYSDAPVYLSYAPGNVKDISGNAMREFWSFSCVNHSAVVAPRVTGIAVSPEAAITPVGGSVTLLVEVQGVGGCSKAWDAFVIGVGAIVKSGDDRVVYTAPESGAGTSAFVTVQPVGHPELGRAIAIAISNPASAQLGKGEVRAEGEFVLTAESGRRATLRVFRLDEPVIDVALMQNGAMVNLTDVVVFGELYDPDGVPVLFGSGDMDETNGRIMRLSSEQGRLRLLVSGLTKRGRYRLLVRRENGSDKRRFGTLFLETE